jgi:hypothetical protein
VVDGDADADPYRTLLTADEADLGLVVLDGVPRLGRPGLMGDLGVAVGDAESLRVGGRKRVLNLVDDSADPLVAGLSLAKATAALDDAMQHLPELAAEDERRPGLRDDGGWRLELDHQPPEEDPVPGGSFLPSGGLLTGFVPAQVAPPLSSVLEPMHPDRLTAVDDAAFVETLRAERNLTPAFRDALVGLYS